MVFSRKKFDEFRSDVEAALEDVGEKYDVSIEAGSISYSDIEFKMGLKMKKKNVDGKSFEQAAFEKHCKMFGFKPADYRREFKERATRGTGTEVWKLVGFNPNAPKYPMIVENSQGKQYRMTLDAVKGAIKNAKLVSE